MANGQPKKRSFIAFTIMLSLLALVVSMFVIENSTYRSNLRSEVDSARSQLSDSDWQKVEAATQARFNRWHIESGLKAGIEKAFLPAEGTTSLSLNRMVPDKYNYRFVNNVQYTAYQASFRIQMMLFWLLTMLPVVIAFCITGYYRWRIKHFSMASGNTIAIKLVATGFITLIAGIVAYIILPSIGIPGSFYIPALIIFAIGLMAGRAIASFHQDFG